jgi:hypothetical protein
MRTALNLAKVEKAAKQRLCPIPIGNKDHHQVFHLQNAAGNMNCVRLAAIPLAPDVIAVKMERSATALIETMKP